MSQERALEDITTTGVFLRGRREGGLWVGTEFAFRAVDLVG